MACLVPQFKCPPSSSDPHFHFRPTCHHSLLHVKARDHACFRSHCVLSPATLVADIEKLKIPLLEPPSHLVAAVSHLTYVGATGQPAKVNFGPTLASEMLLMGDEAVIAAAAAEAITLARAAVEVAKDAAQMTGSNSSMQLEKSEYFPSEADTLRLERARLSKIQHVGTIDHCFSSETKADEEHITQDLSSGIDFSSATPSELQQMQHSKKNTVRSGRQKERKAKRARIAEKSVSSVISVKSKSRTSTRKKRAASRDVDHSDPLRNLRGITSTSRLLTASEELEFSEAIQDLLKMERLRDELVERNGCEPTFVQWAEAARVDQWALRKRLNYGILCKDKMIKSNIRLVISVAKNYQCAGMKLEDLIQEGCAGLIKSTEKFDASKGFKFSTYAHWWIRQAVRKSLTQSRAIRLPFHIVEATYRVKEARKKLYNNNIKDPSDEEVAEVAGITMKRFEAVMLVPKAPISLDQKTGNYQEKPSQMIADPDAEALEDILVKQLLRQDLHKVLDSLSPREEQVVRWRFGLEDGKMRTLQEIGELMGVSRERVRQIESFAFRKLKNKKRTKNLQQYIYLQA